MSGTPRRCPVTSHNDRPRSPAGGTGAGVSTHRGPERIYPRRQVSLTSGAGRRLGRPEHGRTPRNGTPARGEMSLGHFVNGHRKTTFRDGAFCSRSLPAVEVAHAGPQRHPGQGTPCGSPSRRRSTGGRAPCASRHGVGRPLPARIAPPPRPPFHARHGRDAASAKSPKRPAILAPALRVQGGGTGPRGAEAPSNAAPPRKIATPGRRPVLRPRAAPTPASGFGPAPCRTPAEHGGPGAPRTARSGAEAAGPGPP